MDRISIRTRPRGFPVMRQKWGKLLFMHWPIPAARLRSRVPESLSIDTFDGEAWIGLVPFTMWDVRAVLTPSLPGLSAFHELNVRTYVHRDGIPGVYFFSLDASKPLAVWAARRFYHLPYFSAEISLLEDSGRITYRSRRNHENAPSAEFFARWRPGSPLPASEPESLTFFLTERYCLYTEHRGRLYRCRIHHQPWALQEAELEEFHSDLLPSHHLPQPQDPPLLHHAERLPVDIWPLKAVEAFAKTRKALKAIVPDTGPEPGRRPV
jgi:uncharacterized protein